MYSYHRLSENKGNPNPFRLEKLQFFLAENIDIFFCRIHIGADCSGVNKTGYFNPNHLTEVLTGEVMGKNIYDEF